MTVLIAVINKSSVIPDNELEQITNILQKQVDLDFFPIWGINAKLTAFPSHRQPSASHWWLVLLDNTDDGIALGYHDLTDEGFPIGKVFVKTEMLLNKHWTVTASHELLEMLADPGINLVALNENNNRHGVLYAYEICDACCADADGYLIDDVNVSNFVYPSWFEPFWKNVSLRPENLKFDHNNQIKNPFELCSGGYISVRSLESDYGWTQIFGSEQTKERYMNRAQLGSRRERRKTVRENWLKSMVNI